MSYNPLLVVILLLVAIVIFAYFYLKRAQRRDATKAEPRETSQPTTSDPNRPDAG